MSSTRRRVRDLLSQSPPPDWQASDPIAASYLQHLADMDIKLRGEMARLRVEVPAFHTSVVGSGSGLPLADILRSLFGEYLGRLSKHGPHALPTSFNIMASFFDFSERFLAFNLLEEKDHLLKLLDYIDWYTAENQVNADPRILVDVMEDSKIYSFNMVGYRDFSIQTDAGSEIALLGVAMVRRDQELSMLTLAGECPAFPSDEDISPLVPALPPSPGKKALKPDDRLTTANRYLGEMPSFARITLLSRYDLAQGSYDVRYVNLDIGRSFLIGTDDTSILAGVPPHIKLQASEQAQSILNRYNRLHSLATTMMYLPVLFASEGRNVQETSFATELANQADNPVVINAKRVLGVDAIRTERSVRCLPRLTKPSTDVARRVKPPALKHEASGYWKPLKPGDLGKDKQGRSVVGKTWVERSETWAAAAPEEFVGRFPSAPVSGPDPGIVYVVRSESHGNDVFKVGLTRRSAEERARELSRATGVPLPFDVLVAWEVGDCAAIERAAHERLDEYRLNERREFFRVGISHIIDEIEAAIRSTSAR